MSEIGDHRFTIHDAAHLLAALKAECEKQHDRAVAAEARAEQAREEIAEYEQVAALQRKREEPWIRRWQAETGKGPLVLPDYGVLMAWILDKAEQAEQERDEAREVVARVNNSFGSYGYFTKPHPADQVEDLKARSRADQREITRLRAVVEELRNLLPWCERLWARVYGHSGFMNATALTERDTLRRVLDAATAALARAAAETEGT